MPRRRLDSPRSIVILGLLAEQPLHPYGMRVLMRERGHDRIAGHSSGSLYDAVNRLVAAGLVDAQGAQQEGRRPERMVYGLTASGLESLRDWIRQALVDPARAGQFTAALSFMYVLPRHEVIDLLAVRTAAVEELCRAADTAQADALAAGVAPIFLSEGRYSRALLEAERDWLVTFTAEVSSGELGWPSPDHTYQEESP
ncbi:MAG: PadR family transcriptional regulator [Trebonia sp.]